VIDSFEFVAPLAHIIGPDGPLYAGRVASVNEDGELEWDTPKRCEIKGSHEAKLTARSCLSDDFPGRPCVFVQASVKVFQGHNLFGSDDLAGLCREALVFIVRDRGISPAAADLEDWNRGMIAIKRVDPTFMYDLGTPARVQTAIRSMQDRGRLKFRGGTNPHPHGVIFGKGSRRWSLMAYDKFAELRVHPLPGPLQGGHLERYASGKLRIEPRVRALELKRRDLHWAANWGDNTAVELHSELVGRLNIAEADMIEPSKVEGLSGRLQVVYQSWSDGHDLRRMLTRPTFYRYRAELLAHGVDIALPPGGGKFRDADKPSNVVPLRLVLEARMVGVPDWATGTPLYFEPRFKVA
jgi:II/X family phage/plasmid replication protein